jgi:protein ImuB
MRSIVVIHPGWPAAHGGHGVAHSYRTYEHVVRAVTTVSPLVEVEEPGRLVFAARGPARYFGGEQAVVAQVQALVAAAGLGEFGVGVGGSRLVACAAAVSAVGTTPLVVAEPATARFLAELPVDALSTLAGASVEITELFGRLGLHTCGAVAGLGERALIERFGLEGRQIHRLVAGSEERMLDPGAPPPDIVRAVNFDAPLVAVGTVVSSSRRCIEDALSAVAVTGRQCVRVLLACETDNAETNERIWTEPRGFDAPGVAQRLSWQLDGWLMAPSGDDADAVSSGVVRVVVTPLECRDVLVDQPLLWGGNRENAERAARAVSLAMATGAAKSVTVPQWSGGRDVSGEYERVPVDLVDLRDAHAAEERVQRGRNVPRQWRGTLPSPSPAVVHSPPLPVEVFDAAGTQVVVTGRHELSAPPSRVVVGRSGFEVLAHAGPWPVEERWWDPLRRRRVARVQVLVREDRAGTERVLLLVREEGKWALLARYD